MTTQKLVVVVTFVSFLFVEEKASGTARCECHIIYL